MTQEEWKELNDLRAAISERPASVVPEKQERFTELLVKSWSYVDAVPGVDGLISVPASCKKSR
jgi:hypothetical protein